MRNPKASAIQDTRREFVRNCLGLGAALAVAPSACAVTAEPKTTDESIAEPDLYQRVMDTTQRMDLLGHPRSWSAVERELHPFTPERVIITSGVRHSHAWLEQGAQHRLADYLAELQAGERSRWEQQRAGCRAGGDTACWGCKQPNPIHASCYYWHEYQSETWFSKAKFNQVLWLTGTLADYYRVPYAEQWARGMIGREMLGCTGIGQGVAIPHQYQRQTPGLVPVQCPPADWWVFLHPRGMEWNALDEQPIYAVFTMVFRHGVQEPGALRHMCLLSQLVKLFVPDEQTSRHVAQMSRTKVCRLLNRTIAACLADEQRA
jgi:mannitol/fructose-specific phosphotransferase system IIA component